MRSNVLNRLLILFFSCSSALAQTDFSSLDALLAHVQSKSITLQSGEVKMTKAKKAKLAAMIGVLDPSGSQSFSYTNNTRIPVQIIQGQTVETGVPYVTNSTRNGELKLLNLAGWEKLKLAKINIQLTESDNKLTLKSLFENIAVTYYNIVNLQEQILSTDENLKGAEIVLKSATEKYQQGMVKQQDVNDAKASYLSVKESMVQLKLLLETNYLSLKILADIPEDEKIVIKQSITTTFLNDMPEIKWNELNIQNSMLKEKEALSNFKQASKVNLPTLNFFFSNSNQQFNTQSTLFDKNVDWIRSSYVGLKLSFNIPTAESISKKYNAKFDFELAQKNTEQTKIKAELEFKQLGIDYNKALSQAKANREIYELRKDTYYKNQKLYSEGLIGIDQTINSYNAMVNDNYSMISAKVDVMLALSKIDINNKIQ